MARFLTLDVFTATPFGGNQLAVFPTRARSGGAAPRHHAGVQLLRGDVLLPGGEPRAHTARPDLHAGGGEVPFAGTPRWGRRRRSSLSEGALGRRRSSMGRGASSSSSAWGTCRSRCGSRSRRGPGRSSRWRSCPRSVPAADPRDAGGYPLSRCAGPSRGVMSPQAVSCGYPFLLVRTQVRGGVGTRSDPDGVVGADAAARLGPEIFLAPRIPR